MALQNIEKIAKKIGISEKYLEKYGNLKAKVSADINEEIKDNPDGKLVLVTAITPTKAGEGKTTMLRLLLAIIRPGEGQVRITTGDGELEDSLYATAATRSLFAYVPQGNTMFSGTIAQNMRNVKKDATDDEIIKALKMACAWDFVKKLPEGINSEMGEHGSGFSEGQAQRLSIARAILRQSPILLLDEATSALDVWTEKEVLKNIMADEYPRTTIITTHRPSVLKQCDRVYAIRNGNCCKLSDEEISEMESIA